MEGTYQHPEFVVNLSGNVPWQNGNIWKSLIDGRQTKISNFVLWLIRNLWV